MANTTRKVATALAVSATLLTASLATAADTDRRKLVLHVRDYAGLSPTLLSEAKHEVTLIYDAAGVQTIWTNEGDPSSDAAADGALHVKVLILSEEMSERKIAFDNVPNGVLGQAAHVTRRAYVFMPRINRVAAGHHVDTGILLGKVIAHEVGHLVLPERSHSSTGIMGANLNPRGANHDRFTVEQVATIHTVLAAQ
jgi:hypothetical protein